MFLSNKYTTWYFAIISNRHTNIDVAENHHIIPRSLGGKNRKENIVRLTPKEHFVCHWLLTKMTFGENRKKMCYAFWSMTRNNKKTNRSYSSLEYSVARRCFVSSRKGKSYEEIFGKEKAKELRDSRSRTHKGRPKPHAVNNLPKENMSSKTWHITLPSGEEIVIKNLAQFCREHGLSAGNLSHHGKSKGYQAKVLSSELTNMFH